MNKAFLHFLSIFWAYLMIFQSFTMLFTCFILKYDQIKYAKKWRNALLNLPLTHFSIALLKKNPNPDFWHPIRHYSIWKFYNWHLVRFCQIEFVSFLFSPLLISQYKIFKKELHLPSPFAKTGDLFWPDILKFHWFFYQGGANRKDWSK